MVLIWEPITDLPQDWGSLTDGELGPLLQFWNDQRADLEQSGALAEFNKRLGREWAIETGQIEGVYNLDRGLTETLIERGIDSDLIPNQPGQKPPEIIAAIIQDHAEVLEGLFQFVKGSRPLSKSYIHELHAALLRHQDTTAIRNQFGNLFEAKLLKGKYKEHPNNPKKADGSMHQYCPPEQVNSEMERLLALHAEHEKKGVPVEVEAAWLHHRFTQIHPYQDGNGRVARALASLLFLKAGWFPVVVTRDDRGRYIDALGIADEGNLQLLITVFVDIQKRALFQATQAVADIQQIQTVDEAILAAKRALGGAGKGFDPSVWLKAKATADRLIEFASLRLHEISDSLTKEIAKSRPEFVFTVVDDVELVSIFPCPIYPMLRFMKWAAHLRSRPTCNPRTLTLAHTRSGQNSEVSLALWCFSKKHQAWLLPMHGSFRKKSFRSTTPNPTNPPSVASAPWLEESLVNALTLWRKSL